MDVALDSSVLVRDLWLDSQAMRLLRNYLIRTQSHLLVPELVFAEVQATAKRAFTEVADRIDSALHEGKRKRLSLIPGFASKEATQFTMQVWEANFHALLPPDILRVIPHDPTVLPDAIRRATDRIAPCKSTGEGMRDAILWLTVLAYLSRLEACMEIAFVSANTTDFANAAEDDFRPELSADLHSIRTKVHYFRGVAEFNKDHGDRLAHVTVEWVTENGAIDAIQRKMLQAFNYIDLSSYFRVVDRDLDDIYTPQALETVVSADIEITDVSVWRVERTRLEIGIDFNADVTAETVATLAYRPAALWRPSYIYDLDDPQPSERSLTSFAQVKGTLSAQDNEGDVGFGEIENLERR